MSKKICCIYKISSLIKPDRFYIGSTYWFQHRKWRHLRNIKLGCHPNKKIMNHADKYGVEDLIFSVIEIVESKNLLKDAEQRHIDLLNPWFNIQPTAFSNRGFKHSEETKRKMSEWQKGKPKSEEIRKKLSESKKGHKWTEEQRAKFIQSRKGVKRPEFSDEWKANLSKSLKGHTGNIKGWETRRKNKDLKLVA